MSTANPGHTGARSALVTNFADLGWHLAPVVQRSGVCTGGAQLPSDSRVGTHTDTGDRTVHTERCTRDQGPAHRQG